MRFLIVDTDYPVFLEWLYAKHKGLERRSFDEQMRIRAASAFGQHCLLYTSDAADE